MTAEKHRWEKAKRDRTCGNCGHPESAHLRGCAEGDGGCLVMLPPMTLCPCSEFRVMFLDMEQAD